MWLNLRKAGLHTQLLLFRNTNFNYLKYCILGRKNVCMQFAMIHTKQLTPWLNSSISHVLVNYSWLSQLVKGRWSHLKIIQALVNIWQASETQASHSKSSQGNFQHQYLPELLANAYSYYLMVISMFYCCCVCGSWLFSNQVIFIVLIHTCFAIIILPSSSTCTTSLWYALLSCSQCSISIFPSAFNDWLILTYSVYIVQKVFSNISWLHTHIILCRMCVYPYYGHKWFAWYVHPILEGQGPKVWVYGVPHHEHN